MNALIRGSGSTGIGATCFYPHGDFTLRNDTQDSYQLVVTVGERYLEGEWRISAPSEYRYEIVERNRRFVSELLGVYMHHNELWQQRFDFEGRASGFMRNDAISMYAPLLANESSERETTHG